MRVDDVFFRELGGRSRNVPVRVNSWPIKVGQDEKSWPLLMGALVLVEMKLYNALETKNCMSNKLLAQKTQCHCK